MKLYFMIGLPTETHEDVEAIVALTDKIRQRFGGTQRVRRIGLSINPFAPKPWTPLQWEPMEEVRSLKRKIEYLRRAIGRLPGVTLDVESPRESYYATLLSRGDRRVARLLLAIHDAGGDWWRVIRQWSGSDTAPFDPDLFVHRSYAYDEILPWDFIDHALHKRFLWVERDRAYTERQTAPCDVTICRVCGAC
jgi:radical SAM superfamily enzyme YgiQ (UPF0313 family)